ncbi:MAG: thioesterase, partial [Anaerolineaceae bacterium]
RQLPADSSQRPFAFFGHSLGARVGFEVARSLRRQGKPLPAQLFVSACPAPQLPSGRPIHMLPKAAFLAELQRRNGIPQEVLAHPELLELLLPMLRADFMVIETAVYRSEPPLNFPITAFGGIEDPIVSRGALEAWEEQTSGPFNMVFFAGDHFFLRTAEDQLLQTINTTAM